MKSIKYIISIIFFFIASNAFCQARLTIENNSMRQMTVKVMKGTSKGTLHKTVTINSYSSSTIYFSESGKYYTKTKAILNGKEPVYQKGQPFEVQNGSDGYSVMTLTFTIKESAVPQVTGGTQISKQEFDQN